MRDISISRISTHDLRFALEEGAGADSVHSNPQYSYAVTEIQTNGYLSGIGLAFTLGGGNDLVCRAIDDLAGVLVGREVEALMAEFGAVYALMLEHPQYRWLGPHKGVVHLALSSIVNACFDLWAKARGLPLWRLLLDLTPEQLLATLHLRYIDDALSADDALAILRNEHRLRGQRMDILEQGYPGYDTSIGWIQYTDDTIKENLVKSMDQGFDSVKLKVGSDDPARDIRRAFLVRDTVGDDARVMLDVNQQWTLPQALEMCRELRAMNPYWIEEPTHPDDVLAHQALARAVAPMKLAIGEHLPNQVLFKNYLQADAAGFLQPDCVRLGGVSEFIAVSLMARKYDIPVVPHVGDMGQIHQHLVLFNHIALGHEAIFLEYIPHLRQHFTAPARVEGGVYATPQEPGSSSDLKALR
ncbi:MAG: mandelate racemase [Chloroflexi bacterium]|nr:mandelate racemase [Chloroflexota bacterium]